MSDKPPPKSPNELIKYYFDALNAGDVDGLLSLYWSDAALTISGRTLIGKDDIGRFFRDLLEDRLWRSTITLLE
ncbi:MAG: nuclear transport factor 2 family protein, partial [Chloroflexota bacterium]